MANSQYQHVIYGNTEGILSKTPVRILAINFVPGAVSNTLDLNFWDEANPLTGTAAKQFLKSVTITNTTTFTDANTGGVLPNTYTAGSVIRLFPNGMGGGNGKTANHTYHLIATAGNDNVIVTAATLTNDTTTSQLIEAYPARAFYDALISEDSFESKFVTFGSGIVVPNLILAATPANSGYVQIYIA